MVIEDTNKESLINSKSKDELSYANSSSSSYPSSPASYSDAADSAINHWESITKIKLSKGLKRIARLAYNIHFKENRGLIRQDIIDLKYTYTYAKKILYECQSKKLLIPLNGYKKGRFNEYFLSTIIERFLEKQSESKGNGQIVDSKNPPLSVIQILINEITGRKPQFHKFFIHIKMYDPLTATVEQVEDIKQIYLSLTKTKEWIIKSSKNKAKVKQFRLEHKRSCTVKVYPNGKVIVAVECSYRQFNLYDTGGCQEFFETVGKISYILSQEFYGSSVVPPTGEWLLKQYDRDVTLITSELEKKYPHISHWYSKEGIKIRALGRVFQIYGKIMPICGRCLRIEEDVSTKEDVPLEKGIKEAIERPFEIASAFELLRRDKDDSEGKTTK
ncbi:hypothetical protein NMY3_02959 [Candidatus Nitrosocosmicus oleophilus]|uniref:Uncharacterized protein n=1 Tax=Candidatus Nitrosocosmicus oleophilus TaxID=1353260 RepID=A0A654M3D5_9ARCH|nr:hypothetical protein [Candidatus Nitrosocosmicus oleophilus]ALI37146.1 hypothetical protein NMY3_02959 [Candidatus Nitrosocosmicus oleophilus]